MHAPDDLKAVLIRHLALIESKRAERWKTRDDALCHQHHVVIKLMLAGAT